MFNVKLFFLIVIMGCPLFADNTLDDFEDGNGFNRLNYSWYYFSDIIDGGNTAIVNADMVSPGRYSACTPVSPGCSSDYCMKIEYRLGDTRPFRQLNRDGDKEVLCNFAGIGTDLARPGATTDLSHATGISFKARSDDSTDIFIEVVTSTVYDYGYFRKNFRVTENWNEFSVDFINDTGFAQPFFEMYAKDSLDRIKIQKVNWQITGCIDDYYSWTESEVNYKHEGYGALYLDDIVVHAPDTKTIATAAGAVAGRKIYRQSTFDLLGRDAAPANVFGMHTGLFLVRTGSTVKPAMFFNGASGSDK